MSLHSSLTSVFISNMYFEQIDDKTLEMNTEIGYSRIENLGLYFEDLKMNIDRDLFFCSLDFSKKMKSVKKKMQIIVFIV